MGEQDIMEKTINKFEDIVKEVTDSKTLKGVFNKYKRFDVYEKYMCAGVSLIFTLNFVVVFAFKTTHIFI